MDFKKIETIFLVAFLGVNMFLISIFIQNKKANYSLNNGEEKDSIEVRLEKDHITYDGELSTEKEKGYFLSGEDMASEHVEDTIDMQKETTNENHQFLNLRNDYVVSQINVEKEMKKLLNESSFFGYPGEYLYQPLLSSFGKENPKIVATQFYEELPFNDDSAKLEIKLHALQQGNFQLESLNYAHLTNIVPLREKQELISKRAAVATLYYNSKIPQEAKINWCFLAYGKILKVREKNVYVPIWFISITPKEDKTRIEQINAVNNTIITNNAIPTVEK